MVEQLRVYLLQLQLRTDFLENILCTSWLTFCHAFNHIFVARSQPNMGRLWQLTKYNGAYIIVQDVSPWCNPVPGRMGLSDEHSLLSSINFWVPVSPHECFWMRSLCNVGAAPCLLKKAGHIKMVFEPFMLPSLVLYPCQTAASVLPLHQWQYCKWTLPFPRNNGTDRSLTLHNSFPKTHPGPFHHYHQQKRDHRDIILRRPVPRLIERHSSPRHQYWPIHHYIMKEIIHKRLLHGII